MNWTEAHQLSDIEAIEERAMTDEELIARMRDVKLTWGDSLEAAARIEHLAVICEELEAELLETQDRADALATVEKHIEAMTEQLEAAHADAKQAEAYAEDLEESLRARTAERNHANDVTDAAIEEVRRLEAKLAKAVDGLRKSTEQHRLLAGLDLMFASVVGYNAARDGEATLAEIEGEE